LTQAPLLAKKNGQSDRERNLLGSVPKLAVVGFCDSRQDRQNVGWVEGRNPTTTPGESLTQPSMRVVKSFFNFF
jgi:hypothetical protein